MENDKQRLWELLAAFRHGELTPGEQQELDWLKNEYPEEFESSARIKSGLDQLATFSSSDRKSSWDSVADQVRRQKFRHLVSSSFKYAAVIIVSLIVGYFIQSQQSANSKSQLATIEVQYGQTSHIFLFDGTEVWLNAGSKLQYPNQFNSESRDVYLEGEAYFKVTHNEKLPFKVKTRKMEVEVLGTSFDVSAYKDENMAVVLEKGKVKLNSSGGKKLAVMAPGDRAELNRGSNELSVKKVDTEYYTDWKNGSMEFKDEALGEIAKKLERWYNVEIDIRDKGLENYKISGTVLRNKPIQQIMQVFAFLAPIRVDYHSNPNQKDRIDIYKK